MVLLSFNFSLLFQSFGTRGLGFEIRDFFQFFSIVSGQLNMLASDLAKNTLSIFLYCFLIAVDMETVEKYIELSIFLYCFCSRSQKTRNPLKHYLLSIFLYCFPVGSGVVVASGLGAFQFFSIVSIVLTLYRLLFSSMFLSIFLYCFPASAGKPPPSRRQYRLSIFLYCFN